MNTLNTPVSSEKDTPRELPEKQNTISCLDDLKKICESATENRATRTIQIDEKLYENYRKYYDHPIEESGEPMVRIKDFGIIGEDVYALGARKTLDALFLQEGVTGLSLTDPEAQKKDLPESYRKGMSRDIFIQMTSDTQKKLLAEVIGFLGYRGEVRIENSDMIRRAICKYLRGQELAKGIFKNTDIQVRKDIAERIKKINEQLKPRGYQIGIETGYRSEKQQAIIKSYEAQISGKENAEKLYADTGKSSHHSGGAVDTFLADLSGKKINLRLRDNSPATKSLLYGEKLLQEKGSQLIPDERNVIEGRRILWGAMTEGGFTPLITEYWHYGVGDRLSAYIESQISGHIIPAIYGNISP